MILPIIQASCLNVENLLFGRRRRRREKDEIVVCKNACINPLNHFPAVWRMFLFFHLFVHFKPRTHSLTHSLGNTFWNTLTLLLMAGKHVWALLALSHVGCWTHQGAWKEKWKTVEKPSSVRPSVLRRLPGYARECVAQQHHLERASERVTACGVSSVLLETQTSSSAARWSSSASRLRSQEERQISSGL